MLLQELDVLLSELLLHTTGAHGCQAQTVPVGDIGDRSYQVSLHLSLTCELHSPDMLTGNISGRGISGYIHFGGKYTLIHLRNGTAGTAARSCQ